MNVNPFYRLMNDAITESGSLSHRQNNHFPLGLDFILVCGQQLVVYLVQQEWRLSHVCSGERGRKKRLKTAHQLQAQKRRGDTNSQSYE